MATKRRSPTPKDSKTDMVTTTVALDRETYRRLRHLAVDDDSSVRDLIRNAVGEYLERRSRKEGHR